jgi:hypothetical protein
LQRMCSCIPFGHTSHHAFSKMVLIRKHHTLVYLCASAPYRARYESW